MSRLPVSPVSPKIASPADTDELVERLESYARAAEKISDSNTAIRYREAAVALRDERAVRATTELARDRLQIQYATEVEISAVKDDALADAESSLAAAETQMRAMREAHLRPDFIQERLCEAIAGGGSYAALARTVGVSDEFVRQCALGDRPVTGKLLQFLGFESFTVYRSIGAALAPVTTQPKQEPTDAR